MSATKPAGSSPALAVPCPVCNVAAGAYCLKGHGKIQIIAHKKRREAADAGLRARAAEGSQVAFRELEERKLVEEGLQQHAAAFRAANGEEPLAVPSYPEHEKLRAVADKSQACGEFFEWLTERYTLAQWAGEKTLYPASVNIRKLLAEFFQIDEERLEDEKLAMLAALRKGT